MVSSENLAGFKFVRFCRLSSICKIWYKSELNVISISFYLHLHLTLICLFFFFVLTNPGFGGFMEKVSIVEMKQQSGYLLF